MKPAELEELIQRVTDRLIETLQLDQQSVEFIGKNDSYPAWFRNRISADFRCQFNSKQDGDNAILLCLSELTVPELLAVANLVTINKRTERIVDYLCKGKPVWIAEDENNFLKFKQLQRYGVRKAILTGLAKVQSYGVTFVKDEAVLDQVLRQVNKPLPVTKKYVTLQTVVTRHKAHLPLIHANEIPTDLAKEWIHENGDDKS